MAFDISSYFNGPITAGMPTPQLQAAITSLLQQYSAGDQGAAQQISEFIGPQLTQQIIGDYTGNSAPNNPNLPSPLSSITPGVGTSVNAGLNPTSGSATSTVGSLPNSVPGGFQINPGMGLISGSGGHALNFGSPNSDIANILNLGSAQQNEALQTLNTQDASRAKYLNDLSGLLQKQQAQSMSESLPGTYEDLNNRGLLRSSALGNSLAVQAKNLTAETSNQLAQQALANANTYTSGLGNIETSLLNNQNQALQRGLTLEDYNNQVGASQQLGYALQPQQPNNSKANSGAMLSGTGNLASGLSSLSAK